MAIVKAEAAQRSAAQRRECEGYYSRRSHARRFFLPSFLLHPLLLFSFCLDAVLVIKEEKRAGLWLLFIIVLVPLLYSFTVDLLVGRSWHWDWDWAGSAQPRALLES